MRAALNSRLSAPLAKAASLIYISIRPNLAAGRLYSAFAVYVGICKPEKLIINARLSRN